MFRGLVINEFIKLYSKKKTYIILLLFIALSGLLVAVNEATENSYLKYNTPKFRLENVNNQIENEERYLNDIKVDSSLAEEERESLVTESERYLNSLKEEKKSLEQQLKEASADDWKKEANAQIEEYNSLLNDNSIAEEEKAYYEREIEKISTHLENNIPLYESNMNTGINYYVNNIILVASSFLAFGLILFNGDSVSNEYNPATLKFLLIQPVSRIKVLLSKYVVMVINSLGLIMITQFLYFLGVSLFKGVGYFNRPILVDTKYIITRQNGYETIQEIMGSGKYISLGTYLVRALLLQGLFIIVMVTFIFMISTLIKSSVVSLTINIATLMGTSIAYGLSTTYRKLSPYIFIHFSDIDGIITGNIAAKTYTLNFTYITVIVVSIISVLAFLGIALTVFKKRDIQI